VYTDADLGARIVHEEDLGNGMITLLQVKDGDHWVEFDTDGTDCEFSLIEGERT
jgi:hypothetical protein